jgi:hypothetical protein
MYFIVVGAVFIIIIIIIIIILACHLHPKTLCDAVLQPNPPCLVAAEPTVQSVAASHHNRLRNSLLRHPQLHASELFVSIRRRRHSSKSSLSSCRPSSLQAMSRSTQDSPPVQLNHSCRAVSPSKLQAAPSLNTIILVHHNLTCLVAAHITSFAGASFKSQSIFSVHHNPDPKGDSKSIDL